MANLKSTASQRSDECSPAEQSRNRNSQLQPTADVVDYLRQYARQKPDVAALWCLGIGIIIGWKIKPW
ncbi:MAG TPA: hypothetical protein PLY87_08435 [Planctomycetaceae bacterium]|mgnify:CR=1 FL=1|nr:hypothetical protein [Planctomycetaceae bacterium]HQZ65087.1 hypothetical protein [Planctomycetaceae bacterium]